MKAEAVENQKKIATETIKLDKGRTKRHTQLMEFQLAGPPFAAADARLLSFVRDRVHLRSLFHIRCGWCVPTPPGTPHNGSRRTHRRTGVCKGQSHLILRLNAEVFHGSRCRCGAHGDGFRTSDRCKQYLKRQIALPGVA